MDSYNLAIKYLQKRYGKVCGYTSNFSEKLRRARNVAERKKLEAEATDRDRNIVIQPNRIDVKSDDYVMWVLVKQYHCLSSAPKLELKYHLKLRKITEDNFGDIKE